MHKGMITFYDPPTGKGRVASEGERGAMTFHPFHCSGVADHSILTPGVNVVFQLHDESGAAVDVERALVCGGTT